MLGFIWLLDGALQLQSFMFTKGFATGIIAPSANGQPFFVAGPVEWNARMIGAHPALFNGLFASIQLALGLCFLFRRTAQLAIVSSVVWAAGVWYLGEGLGGLGSGTTALLGAPGAALLYMVLAMAPGPARKDHIPDRSLAISVPRNGSSEPGCSMGRLRSAEPPAIQHLTANDQQSAAANASMVQAGWQPLIVVFHRLFRRRV